MSFPTSGRRNSLRLQAKHSLQPVWKIHFFVPMESGSEETGCGELTTPTPLSKKKTFLWTIQLILKFPTKWSNGGPSKAVTLAGSALFLCSLCSSTIMVAHCSEQGTAPNSTKTVRPPQCPGCSCTPWHNSLFPLSNLSYFLILFLFVAIVKSCYTLQILILIWTLTY